MAKTKKTSGASRGPKRSARVSVRASVGRGAKSRKVPVAAGKAGSSGSKPARAGKKKTRLSKKALAEFREILLEKRGQLLGDLSGMEAEAVSQKGGASLPTMPTHMADVGTDNFEHEFTLGLLQSEQAILREIDEALGRIDSGTYGICLGTGEPIPKARLRAKPWAKYTVEHARMLEKGLVRPPDSEGSEEEGQSSDGKDSGALDRQDEE